MFWTINHPTFGPVTLCERCALLALNMASFGFFPRPFGSVTEGLLAINDLCAESGVPGLDGMESDDHGTCGNCNHAVRQMETA